LELYRIYKLIYPMAYGDVISTFSEDIAKQYSIN